MRQSRTKVTTEALRQVLSIAQSESTLTFEAQIRTGLTITGLWYRNSDNWMKAPSVISRVDGAFRVETDINDIKLDLLGGLDPVTGESKLSLLFEVEGAADKISAGARKLADTVYSQSASSQPQSTATARGLISVGRFLRTLRPTFAPVDREHERLVPYVTNKGNIAIAVNYTPPPYIRVHLDSLTVGDDTVARFRGRIYSRHTTFESLELQLTGRFTGAVLSSSMNFELDTTATEQKYGLHKYDYQSDLPLADFLSLTTTGDDTFDAWIIAQAVDHDEPVRGRIGKNRYLVRTKALPGQSVAGDTAVSVVPYFTMKAKNASFQVEFFERNALDLIENAIRHPMAARRRAKRKLSTKPVWLIGEMPYKAQDTGVAFFKYMVDEHPEIDARYVINPESPESINLDGYTEKVVTYRTSEHVELSLAAERIIGSHSPGYVYPTTRAGFVNACRGLEIFLQHGVMGMKWMPPTYGKAATGFSTDLFLTSSEREKRMIVEDFGYSPNEVAVTGLSRFDALFDRDVSLRPKQVLILPTWRDWLGSDEGFINSEFLAEWHGLLSSPEFTELCARHGLEVIFGLHPNMRQHIGMFDDAPVKTFVQGEVNVQTLIKESGLMITDYSSAGLDFSFLHKPLIYFQFDRARFFRGTQSHFDLDRELPGPVCFNASSLLETLERYITSAADNQAIYNERADALYPFRDQSNCERIFEAVANAKRQFSASDFTQTETASVITKRLRQHKYYFPTMRKMYASARRLPINKDLIVFEAGVGRQYSDSPRAIYEELLRRGDTRTKIWVHNGRPPIHDSNTIIVKRLSPQYFWYLARAKYWVNNQNFPHYITRRPNGVFVQTWHGTPLKKMQHDLESITGRSEGYLERVTRAAQQWTHLLSPSPYATEAFSSAFRHRARVLEMGYPRNDVLLAADAPVVAETVRKSLDLPADKKVLLYAPTFRDNQKSRGRFQFELPFDLEAFAERFGDEYVLLIRTHVLVANRIAIPEHLALTVRDVSRYDEISELFLISDALITDYSSVFFDYAVLRRPMIFFAYDLEDYRDNLRGFYLDYETEMPGPVVETEAALYDEIETLSASTDDAESRSLASAFALKYAPRDDGHASSRVVDTVFGIVED
ncbi:MAG: CDP-glycerol glycerophosphotransferase family protein [Brevibacterium aurantiacum]|uniref:CDP-glycerol glycerophosphotransferase family protein n=1 Tax=Brevibacterium aurantiacum TaxID=273384 RepID=UPI003F9303A1